MPLSHKNWESRDFSAKGALLAGAALVIALGLIGVLLLAYQHSALPPLGERNLTPAPPGSPLGEAEFEAGEVRARLDEAALTRLKSYGWVDRERGIVHIPLARAIEIMAGRKPGEKR